MASWGKIILLAGMWLVVAAGKSPGQCDTAIVADEVKTMEALIWSDYPKAVAQAESLVGKYTGTTGWCLARARLALGKTQWTNGDYAASLATLEAAMADARSVKDVESMARINHVKANNYYYQGYYDSAEANFLRALSRFVGMRHRTGQIEVLHDLALMYHRRGDFARSLRYLLELERLKEAEPDFIHYVGDFTGINNYFIDTLYYRDVVRDESRLLQKFKRENNQVGVYQSLINISIALRELGEHRKAGYYAALGSKVMSKIGYYPFWYLAAKEYGLAGMKDSCFYYHRLALGELHRATRIKVAITYEQIGQSYRQFDEPDSALRYFRMAFTLNRAMNNRLTVAALHGDLAKVYDRLGNWPAVERYLEEGVQLAREVSVKHTSALYEFGRDYYEKRGETVKALIFSRLFEKLLDSINRNESAMELMRFQAQLATSKKERELEATRLLLRNRTITLASFIVVATLSVSFMVVFYVQQRRIRRQNAQLNARNQEQRAMVQEIHHRVKNNLQYIVSLLNLQAQTQRNAELTAQIEEIRNRIMTMGVIHQRLYQGQDVYQVDVATFVQELVANLLSTFPTRAPLTKNVEITSLLVDVDTAIALGLLVNELVTNAMKHALVNHPSPLFTLTLKTDQDGLLLKVVDNGPGYRYGASTDGFGTKLIGLLLRKLKGTLQQPDPNTVAIRMEAAVK